MKGIILRARTMEQLTNSPAHQLAVAIRSRRISVRMLVEAHLARIEAKNPLLGAICTLDIAGARDRARVADAALERGEVWGPLHGVPVTIKDLLQTQGLRTTAGFTELADYIPAADAPTVTRLRQAGAIVLGKTNSPRAGGDYQSSNPIFDRTSNPWDLSRTAGGSSGGGASALSAGLSSLDLCSDYGGSIRQPAHFCGVYGLKPTDRRVSTAGHILPQPGLSDSIRQMLTVGILGRSVRDLQLGLTAIAGPTAAGSDVPPVPLEPVEPKPLAKLRLAWCPGIAPLWPQKEIQETIAKATGQLSDAGAELHLFVPDDWDWERWLTVYYQIGTLSLRYAQRPTPAALWQLAQEFWREWWQSDSEFRALTAVRSSLPALLRPDLGNYFAALTERDRLITWLDNKITDYDALLLPVAMTTAFAHCRTGSALTVDGKAVPYWLANGAYLQPFNLTGNPAVVIPIGNDSNDLPIGLQIVGKRWQEMDLLAASEAIDSEVGKMRFPTALA